MKDKVVFCKWGSEKEVAELLGDCYVLSPDNWNDYGYKTLFNVNIYKDGEEYGNLGRKILFENQEEEVSSSSIFEEYLSSSLYTELELIHERYKFISLGYEYNELKKIFPEEFEDILNVLNDVIYLMKKDENNPLLSIKEHAGFEKSLCRDQSSKKMLEEGASFLFGDELDTERFQFNFQFTINNRNYDYRFDFLEDKFPHRINILVGKNGSGKSQTLLALSKYLIHQDSAISKFNITVDKHPNFISNVLVFAYNPHEFFPVGGNQEYKYIGYRRKKKVQDFTVKPFLNIDNGLEILQNIDRTSDLEEIFFSRLNEGAIFLEEHRIANSSLGIPNLESVLFELSKQKQEIVFDSNNISINTFNSFKQIYSKDRNNFAHSILLDEIPYRNKTIEYINKAFDCDGIALKNIKENLALYGTQNFEIKDQYLILRSETINQNFTKDINFNDFEEQLYFIYDDEIIHISTGQKTFVDLVINLLSLIKPNSLILIDEPENTLHPNLEIDFLKILKTVLDEFESFAIIATHSSMIVREVPSKYTRVIKIDSDNQPVIMEPSIHTFGGDIGKITNYVFDDVFIDEKPFEEWIKLQYETYTSFEAFEEEFSDVLNYNILSKARQNWNIDA